MSYARDSGCEVLAQRDIASSLHYVDNATSEKIEKHIEYVINMISKFIQWI